MSARQFVLRDVVSDVARADWCDLRHLVEDVGGVQAAADAIGVTRQSIHAWMHGAEPSLVTMQGVIRLLGFAVVRRSPHWPDRDLDEEKEVCA